VATTVHLKWQIRRVLTYAKLWQFFELLRMACYYFLKIPHDPEFLGIKQLEVTGLCLDLGANQGQSAMTLMSLVPKCKTISFEPNPTCRSYLNVIKSVFSNKFDYQIAAVGSSKGSISLTIPSIDGIDLTQEVTSDPASFYIPATVERFKTLTGKSKYSTRSIQVPVLRLDDLNLESSLIKIDLQGMEIQALEGLKDTIAKNKPIILIELSWEFNQIKEFLAHWGYEPFIFRVKNNSFIRFPKYLPIIGQNNAYFIPQEKFPSIILPELANENE
jgi:FkbM family methyltransferase